MISLTQAKSTILMDHSMIRKKAYVIRKKRDEDEDTPAFRLPYSVRCCPRTASIGPMLSLRLLLNVALDRRPA